MATYQEQIAARAKPKPAPEPAHTKETYAAFLAGATDEQLSKECDTYIWLSAYANNNPRSAYHWMCDLTYDECKRRGKPDIYSQAHKRQSRRF